MNGFLRKGALNPSFPVSFQRKESRDASARLFNLSTFRIGAGCYRGFFFPRRKGRITAQERVDLSQRRQGNGMWNGGQLLVECLVALGATKAFGVPDESYLAVLDALHDT